MAVLQEGGSGPVDPGAPPSTFGRALARLRAAAARKARAPLAFCAADAAGAAAAGALLAAGYVGPFVPEVAFAAPAAVALLVCRAETAGAAVLGAVFGGAFASIGLAWVAKVTVAGALGLVLLAAAGFAVFGAVVQLACRRAGFPCVAVVPPAWVAVELVRAHAFTGFPWLMLAHALSDRTVLIQIADLGGAYAVSFAAALTGAAGADAVRYVCGGRPAAGRRRARACVGAAVAALALQIAYGAWRMATLQSVDGPRLVLVQGNIDTPRGASSDEAHAQMAEQTWQVHDALSRAHAADGALLVWSESMIPNYYDDADDPNARQWRRRLGGLLGEVDRELLSGSNAARAHPAVPGSPAGEYNSAFLIDRKADILCRYDKVHLVPFGEYVPLSRWPLLSGLTPYAAGDAGYAHGSPDQPLMQWEGFRFGVLICYEDAFASLARRATARGADFLVNLSSEAWFAGTCEIPQHLRLSRFRAVENRRTLVRCCNVGATAVVDPLGRTRAMLAGSDAPAGERGAIAAAVPLCGAVAPYVRWGDSFAVLCAAAAGLAVAAAWRRTRPAGRTGAAGGGAPRATAPQGEESVELRLTQERPRP